MLNVNANWRRSGVFTDNYTQQSFICAKSTIETLKKAWNMLKVNNKDIKTTSMTSFQWLYC